MRSSRFQLQSFARRWSAGRGTVTSALVAASMALACAGWIMVGLTGSLTFSQATLERLLGLGADTVQLGLYWQFATFVLVHAGPLHLLGNMLLLYFAGREVEPIIGPRHFLSLYVISNLVGGAVQWVAMAAGLLPSGAVLVGVSAGAAAVACAFATILPELEVTLLLFFVLPVRIRAKHFGIGLALVSALLWLTESATVIGPVAIVAGCIVGWAYAKQLGFGNPTALERYFFERRQHASRVERMPAVQFIEEEVDPILEKLARGGMRSLTRAEKRVLQRGSEKLATRE